jgi:autotransporter-associated beta strand protein
MKINRTNRFLGLLGRFFAASAICISFFGLAHAADIAWNGTTDAAWASGGNWAGGVAPANSITTDKAVFNLTTYPNQPDAGTTSINGLIIGDGTTGTAPLALSGTQLTIGAGGIDMKANAGAATIASPVTLGAAQTWSAAGSGALQLSGTLSGGNFNLTTTGVGTLNFDGAASNLPNIFLTSAASTTSNVGVLSGANITSANIYLFQNNVANGGVNYNQTGGTVTATAEFGIGASTAGGATGRTNNATISGGSLTAGTLFLYKWATSNLTVSNAGVVNAASLRLGWVDASPTGSITLGDGVTFSGGTGISDGGTSGVLNVTAWNIQNNRNYALNFNGGTLKAGADSASWLPAGAFASAAVQDAGGIIDNGGFAITIGQALNHGGASATDGGLAFKGAGTTTLIAANTYNGPTTVLGGSVILPETTMTSGISLADGTSLTIKGNTGTTIGGVSPINSLTLGSTAGTGTATLNFTNFVSGTEPLIYASSVTTKAAPQGVTLNIDGTFTGTGTFPLFWYDEAAIGGDGFAALKLGALPRNVGATLVNNTGDQSLDLNVTTFNPTIWTGGTDNLWDLTTTNWILNAAPTNYQEGDIVQFNDANAVGTGAISVTLDSVVTPGSVSFINETRNVSIGGTGAIAGTGGLSKTNAATLTLGTANTYTGATSISGGTLAVNHPNALGATSAGTTVSTGGVLDLNGTALAAEPLTLNGTGIAAGGALVNSSGTAATTGSPITLGTAASVGGSGDMTLSGDIAGSTGLTKVGAGMTTFSSRKSYTGDTVVNGGVLNLTGGGGAGGTIRGAVTVNTGGSLRLSTGDATGYSLGTDRLTAINLLGGNMHIATTSNQTLGAAGVTMQGGSLTGVTGSNLDFFTENNADPLLRSSFTTLASADTAVVSGVRLKMRQEDGVIFNVADGAAAIDLDVQSNLAADGFTNMQLVKNGPGTMRISGLSTYAAPTILNQGTLIVPSAQSSTDFVVADGTTLGIAGAPGSTFTTSSMTIGTAGATTLNVANFGGQLSAACISARHLRKISRHLRKSTSVPMCRARVLHSCRISSRVIQ